MRTLRFTALILVLALLLSVPPLVPPGLSAQSRPLLRLDLPQLSPGRVLLTGEAASPEPAHITLTLLGEDGSAVTLLDTTAGEAEIRQGVSRITAGVCYTAVLSVGDASVSRRFRALPSDPSAALFSGQTEQDAWVGLYREGVLLASGRADSSGSFTIPYAPEGLCTLRAETGSAVLEEAALVAAALGVDRAQALPDETEEAVSRLPAATVPSIYQDYMMHRQMEVDIFSGELCRLGRELGIPTPYNDAVRDILTAMNEKNIPDQP